MLCFLASIICWEIGWGRDVDLFAPRRVFVSLQGDICNATEDAFLFLPNVHVFDDHLWF